MKVALLIRGIEAGFVFTPFSFIFDYLLSFEQRDEITLHNPSIADLKKTLFFSDHSSGKIYRRNENRDIVHLLTIFHEKSPRPSAS